MTAKSVRAVLLLLAAGAAGVACRKPPASEPETTAEAAKAAAEAPADHEALPESVRLTAAAISEAGITTWKVQPVDLEHMLVLTGSVDYDENRLLQIAANVKGRAAAIRVDLGARVRKGDPILEVESVELGRAREELLAELSGLRVSARAYERAKTLVEAKAISAGEFQSREGDYLAKKAAAEAAERALHLYGVGDEEIAALKASVESDGKLLSGHDAPRLILRAPFDGRVIDRKVTPGSLFEALQPLVTVADLSSVWVFLQAYEKDLALLHEGVPVTIRTEAFPQEAFEGRVDFLGSVVDKATRTVASEGHRRQPRREAPPRHVRQGAGPRAQAGSRGEGDRRGAAGGASDAGGPDDGVRPDGARRLRAPLRGDRAHLRGVHRDPLRGQARRSDRHRGKLRPEVRVRQGVARGGGVTC